MPQKKYTVTLTKDEENVLRDIMNKGKHSAGKRKRAQALLLANEGYTDQVIADRVGMHWRGRSVQTVNCPVFSAPSYRWFFC
jgi:hypothetical protein